MRRTLIFALVFLSSILLVQSSGYAQPDQQRVDTTFLKVKGNGKFKPTKRSKATHFKTVHYKNGQMVELMVANTETGNLVMHKYYANGKPVGRWEYFNANGELTRIRDFTRLVYCPCEQRLDSIPPDGLILPVFGSGDADLLKYLSENIVYPVESKNNYTTGTLYISFVVNKDGHPTDLCICGQGLDAYCDLVVWEIVENMPAWSPGELNGEYAEVEYRLPVKFTLR